MQRGHLVPVHVIKGLENDFQLAKEMFVLDIRLVAWHQFWKQRRKILHLPNLQCNPMPNGQHAPIVHLCLLVTKIDIDI
jgi:hypothetical protein